MRDFIWYYGLQWFLFYVKLTSADWRELNLPLQHIPMFFENRLDLKSACQLDPSCPFKNILSKKTCWGFEENCENGYLPDFTQDCSGDDKHRFWEQVDMGYLKNRLEEMKSRVICRPQRKSDSSLICTKDATMCRARNLFFHLPKLTEKQDRQVLVPEEGALGGQCNLDKQMLDRETATKRSLSTWGYQLQQFKSLKFNPSEGDQGSCDIVMKKPVIFMQLDAVGNLYHHFCDFFNLYLTQLGNSSTFDTDVQIVRWSDHSWFRDPFMDVWKVFSTNEIWSLNNFVGKKVCIPEAVFSFLPRMAYGLYYSTYMVPGCRGSRLIKSFADHVLHRLNITSDAAGRSDVIRVTFLQRGGAGMVFRRVLNIDNLMKRLKKIPFLEAKVVNYNEMNFLEQLKTTQNTDIFIGMHGAGLTHFLFLPDWAVAFELYNCGDVRCYRDLATLRGLHYITWEDDSKLAAHNQNEHPHYGDQAKFWNYSFDVEEFIRLIRKARNLLLRSERFRHLKTQKSSLREPTKKNEL